MDLPGPKPVGSFDDIGGKCSTTKKTTDPCTKGFSAPYTQPPDRDQDDSEPPIVPKEEGSGRSATISPGIATVPEVNTLSSAVTEPEIKEEDDLYGATPAPKASARVLGQKAPALEPPDWTRDAFPRATVAGQELPPPYTARLESRKRRRSITAGEDRRHGHHTSVPQEALGDF